MPQDITLELGTVEIVLEVPPRGPVSNGTSDHTLLSNRDAPDQHPMSAVTGLVAALLGKADTATVAAAFDEIGGISPKADQVHASQHATGGDDALTPAAIGAASAADLAAKADLVGGVIPTAQIPAVAVTEFFQVADESEMLALDAQTGDVALRADLSTAFILYGDDPSVLGDWVAWPMPGAAVVSVNGQTGVIVLSAADVGAVPTSRTVNGKALSANVTLDASDVGAAPATRTIGTGLATSGTVDLDLATLNGTTQWITATGALTFTTSNRAAGRSVSLVVDAGASDRSLTWPGWLASGGGLPDEVEAGTRLHVSVVFLDGTDGAASAGWAVFE